MPAGKPIPKPSVCVCLNVRRASRAITKLYDQALKPSGLKVTQFSALMNIDAHGPLTTSALAKILMLERTTLVRNLKLLENAGFIENSPSPDPRERQISITAHGRHAIGQAQTRWRTVQRQMKQQIGTEQLQMLGHLVTVLEGMADGQGTSPP